MNTPQVPTSKRNKTKTKKKPGGFFIEQHDIFYMAENNEKGFKDLNEHFSR